MIVEPDRKPWTAAETKLLSKLGSQGVPHSRIAELLARSAVSVDHKSRERGYTHLRRTWTADEVDQALAMHREGKPVPDIARTLSRAMPSVNRILMRMGANEPLASTGRMRKTSDYRISSPALSM